MPNTEESPRNSLPPDEKSSKLAQLQKDLPKNVRVDNKILDPDSFNPYDFLSQEAKDFALQFGHLQMNRDLQEIQALVAQAVSNNWLTSEEVGLITDRLAGLQNALDTYRLLGLVKRLCTDPRYKLPEKIGISVAEEAVLISNLET